MDNINTLDELFEKWIEKQNEENPGTYLPKEIPAYSFDKDGYICKDEYENSKTRILFVGKEKYKFWKTGQKVKAKHVSDLIGETLDCDRALTEDEAIKFNIKWNEIDKGFWLKNIIENESYKETMYSKRVSMLTNAIMSKKFDEPDKSHEVLRKIATINLNKRGGFNRCRWDVLEKYTRRYAKFINREIELLKPDINQIKRESSYYTQSHKGEYKETSNRLEEIIAMQMFNLSEDGKIFSHIGKIIDYQTPLKDEQGDEAGKIDLLSYDGNTLYLLELKRPDSKETMLRCVLEGFTYLTTVSGAKDKLISDFNKKAGISISDNTPVVTAPLVFLGGCQHKEMNEGRNSVEKLMKQLDIKPFYLAKIDSGFEVFDAEKTKSKSWKKENLNLALKWPNLDFGVSYDAIIKERMVRKAEPYILGGMWNGKEYQHICKELALNFIDGEATLMADFKGYLSGDKIKYHHGATHLNSSQVMCISFFKKFFEYKKYELLLDVLRKAGIKIEDGAKIEAAAVEYEPNHSERTNFDFYILLTSGKHISFECKFTEPEFGGISKTEDTYKYVDKWDKTYSALLKDSFYFKGKDCDCEDKHCLLDGVLSKSCEKKKTCFIYEFHKYYQINRNILYATDKDDYVIFLTPRENKALDKERKHIDILAERYGTDHIKNLYWEDLIETTLEVVKDDADLYEYYMKFEYKYFDKKSFM